MTVRKKKRIKVLIFGKNLDSGTGTFALQLKKLENEFSVKLAFLEKNRYRSKSENSHILFYSKAPTYRGYYGLNIFWFIELVGEIIWFGKICRKVSPDVIISLNTHCNAVMLVVRSALRLRVKTIISWDNNVSEVINTKLIRIFHPLLRLTGGYFFSKASEIIYVSEGVAKGVRRHFDIKVKGVVINYGVDTEKINNQTSGQRASRGVDSIISVGRFEKQKDFISLLSMFANIKFTYPHLKLTLVGDGSERKKLENFAKKLKIERSVRFVGWRKNVYKYLRDADLFVFSSNYEGFGLTIVEAMFCGLPVIATDSPYGPSEILDNGKYGVLIPVGNIRIMQSEVEELINNPRKRLHLKRRSISRCRIYSEKKMLSEYRSTILSTYYS